MTDKEFRKLSRVELLEMLLDQMRENERLQAEVEDLKAQLADRQIHIANAGSIAEAALRINGVFQAAEAAARQYLDNIHRLHIEQPIIDPATEALLRDFTEKKSEN